MCNIEYKKSIIESTLASAKLYYDDRIKNIENISRETNQVQTQNGENVNNTQSQPTTSTNGLTLTSLKKRLSSKRKKSKPELKIKEENDNEQINGDSDESKSNPLKESSNPEFSQSKQNEDSDENNLTEQNEEELDEETDLISNSQMAPSELAAHLVNKIDRKVQLLDRLWQELNRQSLNYNNILINFYQNLQLLNKSFELVNQKLNENEHLVAKINTINELESEKLAEELEIIKNFQLRLSTYQPIIDEMCLQYSNINQELQNCGSPKNTATMAFSAKFDDLNIRWSNLQSQLQDKYLHIYSLVESSGANIFLKLADSVQSPWQRGISVNKVPYYIKYDILI